MKYICTSIIFIFLGSISSHETKYAILDQSHTPYSLKVSGDCVPNSVTATIRAAVLDAQSSTVLVFKDKDGQIQALTSFNEDFIKKDNTDPMPHVRYEKSLNEIY